MKKIIKKSRTSCHLYDSAFIRSDKNYMLIIADSAEKRKR